MSCLAVSFIVVAKNPVTDYGTPTPSALLKAIPQTLRRLSFPHADTVALSPPGEITNAAAWKRGGPGRSLVGDERIPGRKGGRPGDCEGGVRADGC